MTLLVNGDSVENAGLRDSMHTGLETGELAFPVPEGDLGVIS